MQDPSRSLQPSHSHRCEQQQNAWVRRAIDLTHLQGGCQEIMPNPSKYNSCLGISYYALYLLCVENYTWGIEKDYIHNWRLLVGITIAYWVIGLLSTVYLFGIDFMEAMYSDQYTASPDEKLFCNSCSCSATLVPLFPPPPNNSNSAFNAHFYS